MTYQRHNLPLGGTQTLTIVIREVFEDGLDATNRQACARLVLPDILFLFGDEFHKALPDGTRVHNW